MWKVLRKMQPLSVVKMDSAKRIWQYKSFKYTVGPAVISAAIYYMNNHSANPSIQEDLPTDFETFAPEKQNRFIQMVRYVLRVLQLSFIFFPTIVCLPLYLFKVTRQYWINIFLSAIKRAGIVWIKAFQYLSHRRDIIGEEMAEKFSILRENSPLHTFTQTEQIFTRVYGRKISEMFEEFDTTPIASGSVSQVYKGKLNGKIVAIKVRHPTAGNNLERDIELLFSFSRFLSFFSKLFEVPVTEDSLKKILREQLCFLQQKRNIDNFNRIIIDRNVRFPQTYPQSTNQVLIEEYIDAKTIGFYEINDHNLNKVIANIGAKAFFSMLMKYNFIHADCHAGNILVKFKEVPHELSSVLYAYANQAQNYIISKVIKYGFKSQFLKKLSQENYGYEKSIQQLIDAEKKSVEIVMIDVGMAIRLTKEKKESFQQFLSEIIQGNPIECAKWIFRISKLNGASLKEGQHQFYLKDLEIMFTRVHQTTLDSLQGIVVLKEMLGVIRNHNMKIDGQISILLTNMLILQAIAKDLDPNINILRCAVPYLHYK